LRVGAAAAVEVCTGGSTSPRLLIPFLYQKSRSQADDAEDRDARSGRRRNEADAETGDQQTGREDELTARLVGREVTIADLRDRGDDDDNAGQQRKPAGANVGSHAWYVPDRALSAPACLHRGGRQAEDRAATQHAHGHVATRKQCRALLAPHADGGAAARARG